MKTSPSKPSQIQPSKEKYVLSMSPLPPPTKLERVQHLSPPPPSPPMAKVKSCSPMKIEDEAARRISGRSTWFL